MLENEIDVVTLTADLPDRFAEVADLLEPGVVFRRPDLGQFAPALELAPVDDTFGAELHDEIALIFV